MLLVISYLALYHGADNCCFLAITIAAIRANLQISYKEKDWLGLRRVFVEPEEETAS